VADTPEPKGKSQFGFLTRKIGPLPVWAYAAIAVGAYYWYTHYGPGASKKAAAAQPAGQRPQVIIVQDKDKGGKPGPPGPPGPGQPGPNPPPPRPVRRPPVSHPIGRIPGQGPPPRPRIRPIGTLADQQPITAAAPMTAGDIYGDIPTASPDGSTYDSGYPSAAQLEGTYVPAG